jgi:glycosyltransferase involved in cell wall biosynthesis
MIYFAYIVLGFALLQLIVVGINWIFRQRLKQQYAHNDKLVSVLIPARNEENNIASILGDLRNQTYNNIEIIVLDDDSSDNTAAIIAQQIQQDTRISLLQSKGLPKGWLGKNYACHQMAKQAKGEYLLYLDADVRIQPELIAKLLYFSVQKQKQLVSIFPKQEMISAGEWKTVPLMNYILLTLLPLILVRFPYFSSLSAANGQCMFFSQQSYQSILPHQQLKNTAVEDIEIARLYKKRKQHIACLASVEDITCRMYSNNDEAITGFSKNCLSFFGGSALLGIIFWGITSISFIVLLWFPLLFAIYLIMVIITRIGVSVISHQSVIKNLQYLLYQHIYLGILLISAIKNKHKRHLLWKERNIYHS